MAARTIATSPPAVPLPRKPHHTAGNARRDVEAAYPGIESVIGGRCAFDNAAKVVAKLTQDRSAAKPVGRLAVSLGMSHVFNSVRMRSRSSGAA